MAHNGNRPPTATNPSPWTAPYRMPSGPSVAVVAARTPAGVYRAINPCAFMGRNPTSHAKQLVDSIVWLLGSGNLAGVEWTGYAYPSLPRYLSATLGVADQEPFKLPTGVWLYEWERQPDPDYPRPWGRYGVIATEGRRVGDLYGHRP